MPELLNTFFVAGQVSIENFLLLADLLLLLLPLDTIHSTTVLVSPTWVWACKELGGTSLETLLLLLCTNISYKNPCIRVGVEILFANFVVC